MPSIFLSYSTEDRRFVRRLEAALRERGFRVWVDAGELLIGDPLLEKIGNAIKGMEFFGVVLSPNAAKSPWVQTEIEIALEIEDEMRQTKVLPILYRPSEVPIPLQSRLWADFTKRGGFDAGVKALATRLAGSLSLGARILETWQPKAVRQGLSFGVLKATPRGPAFTERFLGALKKRMTQEPEKFNINVLLATLDTTPHKVTEEELIEFGGQANEQMILYLLELAIGTGIVLEENGGLIVHDSLKSEAVDYFAENSYRTYKAFKKDAETLFRSMVSARLILRRPASVAFGPMVATIALLTFNNRDNLRALWKGALRPGAVE